MFTIRRMEQCLLAMLCCAAVIGLPEAARAAGTTSTAPGQLKVMFIIRGPGQERSQVVENVLAQAFLKRGYKVIDADTVTQGLRRNAYLLKQSEIEAAKRLGSGLGADITVSGEAKSRVVEKSYTLLEGKKVIGSQANVSVKAVLARTGRIIVTENAWQRKPFDTTGDIALQMAAEAAAGRLLQGLEEFLNRHTTDYSLLVLDVNDTSQSLAFQEGLRNQVKGVRQVDEHGFKQNALELRVSVEKDQDLSFKQSLLAQLPSLGLGTLEVSAWEGETIYLRKVGGSMPAQPRPSSSSQHQPSGSPPIPPRPQDTQSRQAPPDVAKRTTPPSVPADASTTYNLNYRKSWAVVIGVNEYEQWPKLQYAVNDARAVEELVRGLGFNEVISILDGQATRQHILRVLGDELYAKTQEDDRVFIFFAGHGQTQDLPNGRKDGYIIPVDGDLKDYYSTAISMLQLQGLADRTRAKHMFYAIDACFSGLLRQIRIDLTIPLTRQVLTAGSEGQQVVELGGHGLFTKALMSGLAGTADENKDGYITGSELHRYIRAQVLKESRNLQDPVFGRLDPGHGEFVFVRK